MRVHLLNFSWPFEGCLSITDNGNEGSINNNGNDYNDDSDSDRTEVMDIICRVPEGFDEYVNHVTLVCACCRKI